MRERFFFVTWLDCASFWSAVATKLSAKKAIKININKKCRMESNPGRWRHGQRPSSTTIVSLHCVAAVASEAVAESASVVVVVVVAQRSVTAISVVIRYFFSPKIFQKNSNWHHWRYTRSMQSQHFWRNLIHSQANKKRIHLLTHICIYWSIVVLEHEHALQRQYRKVMQLRSIELHQDHSMSNRWERDNDTIYRIYTDDDAATGVNAGATGSRRSDCNSRSARLYNVNKTFMMWWWEKEQCCVCCYEMIVDEEADGEVRTSVFWRANVATPFGSNASATTRLSKKIIIDRDI